MDFMLKNKYNCNAKIEPKKSETEHLNNGARDLPRRGLNRRDEG